MCLPAEPGVRKVMGSEATPAVSPARVLHVEVGGAYGGSLRALELYLRYCNQQSVIHDVLFYYPTPGADCVRPLVRAVYFLSDRAPNSSEASGVVRSAARGVSRLTQDIGLPLNCLRELMRLGMDMPTGYRLLRFLGEQRYDLVHVNNTFTYQPATLFAAAWRGCPVVSHVRNPVERTRVSRLLLSLTKGVAVVNSLTAATLRTWGTNSRVETCYDGLEQPDPDPRVVAELRKALTPENEILVGSLGRLTEQKAFHIFLRSARLVLDREPNVRFAIAGDGPLRSDLESEARTLGLSGRLKFTGFRTDPQNFIAALDVFVSSSLWEGMPLSVAEASLLGRAVVATRIPGIRELVGPEEADRLAPPNDPEALAEQILKTVRKDRLEGSAGREAAACRVRDMLDPKRSAMRFDSLVDSLISRRTVPRSSLGGQIANTN